ncbi:hypothetical protein ACFWGI_06430 [Streptomyces niveus]|uniref:hypothetical protein n=1 Tax=Streptomyces niveus TaxID=193462 RepID=UPI00366431B6
MPYTYQCPRCGTESRRYTLRSGADGHGSRHRYLRHGNDHPLGERVEHLTWGSLFARASAWRLTKGDRTALAVVVILVLWSIWTTFTS